VIEANALHRARLTKSTLTVTGSHAIGDKHENFAI
jgi:hypothetical protein